MNAAKVLSVLFFVCSVYTVFYSLKKADNVEHGMSDSQLYNYVRFWSNAFGISIFATFLSAFLVAAAFLQ